MNQDPAALPNRGPLPYDEQRCGYLTEALARTLAQGAPQRWRRIDLKVLMTAGITDAALTVVMPGGRTPEVQPAREIGEIAAELRSRLYRPGEGTWFGMRFLMDPPGTYWVSYNTDFDPLWNPPIPAEAYARDLAAFPRDEKHVPGWLRARSEHTPPWSGQAGR